MTQRGKVLCDGRPSWSAEEKKVREDRLKIPERVCVGSEPA